MTSSATHEARPVAPNESVTSPKRLSRLNDFMSRSRTSSLPVRPQSSSGVQSSTSRQKIGQKISSFKGKGKDRADAEGETSRKAASSTVSVVDPFAANPTASSSFMTFSPTSTPTVLSPPKKLPAPLNMRPHTANSDETESVMSQPTSPTSPTPATQTFSTPGRRRGSILVAASDALSSFARKTPMRSLHLNMGGIGRTNSTKSFATTAQPIILTEVIEISESAVRASKRREEEEEERERLREAAARALGINDKEGDASSMNSRQRSGLLDIEEPGEEEDAENGEYRGWGDDSITPTATSLPGLPPAPTHSRTRSSSYIPPHTLASLPARSSTPLSTFSSQHASQQHSTSVSTHPMTPKSFSTPPSSVAPTLRINTFNSSKSYTDDTSFGPVPEIPPFPSTPAALTPFTQLSATFPRYYPAPSLLMFTLTKQWKNRYLVFTSPPISPSSQKAMFRSPLSSDSTSVTTPVPSYLHLFKTDGKEEKEIERLEINEESVVYVAEGEVGGRKGVIKVGGSLKKKPSTVTVRRPSTSGTATSVNAPTASSRTSSSSMGSVEEPITSEGGVLTNFENASTSSSNGQSVEGRTMWVVQITDPEEAQEWIGAIKGAVLNQRSIRAGLGMPTAVNGMEPRGDLDVVLSMRAQGLFPSPTVPHVDYHNMNGNATVRSQGATSPTNSTFTGDSGHASPITQWSRAPSAAASSMTSWETGSTAATSLANGSSSPIPRATTALKSLFTIGGGRPRSPSTSSVTAPALTVDGEERPEDSFGHAGASLMGMNRSNSYINDSLASPNTPTLSTPRAGSPIIPQEVFLERKILPDPDRQLLENEVTADLPSIKKASPSSLGFGRPREGRERHSVPIRVSSDGITSIALQPPPPRKRAGTVNSTTLSVSVSSPTDSSPSTPTYTYSHTNTSTAESLGVSMGVKSSNLLTPPLPTTPTSPGMNNTNGNGKRRVTRASWSSVSTYGSGDQTPSSPEEARSRRWSRRSSVPHRMSPPYPSMSSPPSSPLMQDRLTPPIRHPYASEDVSLSRSSSVGSGHSRVSELHTRPFSSKRASAVSVQTSSTASTQHSYPASANKAVFATVRPKSAKRASLPPPQRPAPNSALPPTPSENGHAGPAMAPVQPHSAPRTLRESLTLRGNKRLSTSPPTQPPASALPPRPDEPGYHHPVYNHRRSSSSGNASSPLVPTECMPTSAVRAQAPTLPPTSPLPPPPRPHTANGSSPSRSASIIGRRLRILSSPPSTAPSNSRPAIDDFADQYIGMGPISIPESPIIPGPITTLQNNASFLRMSPQTPDNDFLLDAAPQGLSPPPRRGSRQVATPDKEKLQDEVGPSTSTDSGTSESSREFKADSPVLAPPPELDAFPPLSPPAVRSSDHSAVSLVDVRI